MIIILFTAFCYSAVLAWQLAKQIEHKEKDKKRKAKREANMAKARRHKSDWVKASDFSVVLWFLDFQVVFLCIFFFPIQLH